MAPNTVHRVTRLGLAFVFAWHGLVPKLLCRHPDEVAMLHDAGVPADLSELILTLFSITELALALCLLLFWHRRWPPLICLVAMGLATVGVIVTSPRFVTAAFNPVSLNLAVACLAIIDLLTLSSREK